MSSLLLSFLAILVFTQFLIVFFKANAGVMLLAACTGFVLLSSIDPVVITTAGAVVPSEGEAYVRLAVILFSMVFTALFFRNSVKGSQLIMHSIIGAVLSIILLLLLPETTGVSWLLEATDEQAWIDVNEYRSLFVATGFGLSLIAIMTTMKKHHKKSKH
jgi:hypothetical protein